MNVLVVSPQFQFPPRSGLNVRIYQLLRQLAARHQVTLLTYAHPGQNEDAARLAEEIPVEVVYRGQRSEWRKRFAQLGSIASSRPFDARATYSKEMQRAVYDLCARKSIELVQVESASLCELDFPPNVSVILDEHNIEYELFQRMSEGERSLPRRLFHRWEYRRYRRFEQRCWRRVDGCIVTSSREQPIVQAFAPRTPTMVAPNGVDLDYFRPATTAVEPYTVLFNGTLDYRPNVDAVHHLVEEIWPLVLSHCPDARLTVVGRGQEAELRRLRDRGIVATGEVPDVRPYLERAHVVVVPLRMGGGTRLKVVEALAMGKAMVSTPLGCEGISVRDGEHLLIGQEPAAFAARIRELFDRSDLVRALGHAGRKLVEDEYSWELAGERVEALYRSVKGDRYAVNGTVCAGAAALPEVAS